jgi:hypothetical protein
MEGRLQGDAMCQACEEDEFWAQAVIRAPVPRRPWEAPRVVPVNGRPPREATLPLPAPPVSALDGH